MTTHVHTKTKSTSSPFQTTLYLSNLPPTVRIPHLELILTHPPPLRHARRKEAATRESGIAMVQIYTIARKSHEARSLAALRGSFRKVLCIPSAPDEGILKTQTGTTRGKWTILSDHTREVAEEVDRLAHNQVNALGIRDAGLANARRLSSESHADSARAVESEDPDQRDRIEIGFNVREIEDTVAHIHFCCEYHLCRAKSIFSCLTIDGRNIQVRTKRFNPGPLRRLWKKRSQ
ncbi:hypothetical protein IAR55_003790 [Kwoniella newhampshirensis]|uniref:RRM domain-containing protein n=1 Tax=Kwoniella newhampshirensis TaxID=1651941 RepID=A0AAW0YY84_9TREE